MDSSKLEMKGLRLVTLFRGRLVFWCPGCCEVHAPTVDGSRGWSWDENYAAPTLSPSVLSRRPLENGQELRCHLFLRQGRLEFLTDSTHELAGTTIRLEPIADHW